MARSGTSVGTVVRWDEAEGTGLIDIPDVGGDCAAEAAALDPRAGGALRAGQIVDVEWTGAAGDGSVRIERITLRDDLQGTPGA